MHSLHCHNHRRLLRPYGDPIPLISVNHCCCYFTELNIRAQQAPLPSTSAQAQLYCCPATQTTISGAGIGIASSSEVCKGIRPLMTEYISGLPIMREEGVHVQKDRPRSQALAICSVRCVRLSRARKRTYQDCSNARTYPCHHSLHICLCLSSPSMADPGQKAHRGDE